MTMKALIKGIQDRFSQTRLSKKASFSQNFVLIIEPPLFHLPLLQDQLLVDEYQAQQRADDDDAETSDTPGQEYDSVAKTTSDFSSKSGYLPTASTSGQSLHSVIGNSPNLPAPPEMAVQYSSDED